MLAEWGAARYSFYTLRFVDSKVDIYFAFVTIPIARALYWKKIYFTYWKGSHKYSIKFQNYLG